MLSFFVFFFWCRWQLLILGPSPSAMADSPVSCSVRSPTVSKSKKILGFCSHCHRPHCDCGSGFPRFVPEEHKKQWAMSFSQSQNDDRFSVLLWFLWPGQHVQDYLQILQGQAKRDAFQNQNLCRQLCNRILG